MTDDSYLNIRHCGEGVELSVGWTTDDGREPSITFMLSDIEAQDLMACLESADACARRAALEAGGDPRDTDPDLPRTVARGGAHDDGRGVLVGPFRLDDYRDTVLRDPRRGDPDMRWAVGVGADGELLWDDWDDNEPHLLIGGASGSGKSTLVASMLHQLTHNNDSSDLQLWMVDDRDQLRQFSDCAHAGRYLDREPFGGPLLSAWVDLMADAVKEMERRLAALGSGRQDFPRIVIVISECAHYFQASPHEQEMRAAGLSLVEQLARAPRDVGIHLAAATHYPVRDNLPEVLRANSRAIGLRTADGLGSRVLLGQLGLERLLMPGQGMVMSGGSPLLFRGFHLERGADGSPSWVGVSG